MKSELLRKNKLILDDRFLLLTNDHLFQTSAEENHAMDSNVSHLQQHQNGNNAKQNLKKSGESVTVCSYIIA